MATYEISMSGVRGSLPVPGPLVAPVRARTVTVPGTRTLLLVTVPDARALDAALWRLADLGFELLDVRRTPAGRTTPTGLRSAGAREATYEVRVLGRVGPVLLHAIPHDRSSYESGTQTVVAETLDDVPLDDVLASVLRADGQLDSVRLRPQVTRGEGRPPGGRPG